MNYEAEARKFVDWSYDMVNKVSYESEVIALTLLLQRAVEEERERCAKIAQDQWANRTHGYRQQCCEGSYDECAEYIAQAIRNQGRE